MNKYIKKPIEIEAVQLTERNILQVMEWANSIMPENKKIQVSYNPACGKQGDSPYNGLLIPTKEGEMLCAFSDYLIKEPFPTDDRMFYPCKPDMFDLTYQSI